MIVKGPCHYPRTGRDSQSMRHQWGQQARTTLFAARLPFQALGPGQDRSTAQLPASRTPLRANACDEFRA